MEQDIIRRAEEGSWGNRLSREDRKGKMEEITCVQRLPVVTHSKCIKCDF